MEVLNVKKQIKSKSTLPFYIFTGEEIQVMNLYIDKIASCKNAIVQRIDSLADVYSRFKNNAFIQQSYCYVLRDDSDIITRETLWTDLSENHVQGDNIVILILTNIDKRSKFYKHFKEYIVEFKPLPDNILIKYIKKDINLNDVNCQNLISICEHDYGRILIEIDKINCYNKANPQFSADKCFTDLVNCGTIYKPPNDAIFDYIDSLLKREVHKSFELLDQCIKLGESPIVLLSVLYKNVRQVIQVQSYKGTDIEKATGLSRWEIKCAKEKSGYYSVSELIYLLGLIRKLEKGVKTGEIESDMVMNYININMLI